MGFLTTINANIIETPVQYLFLEARWHFFGVD